jgi:8-oxo-dGTP pyrophosphatase MutT (NUDIX family)
MALPGGRHHPSDPDVHHTALRETLEEVGIDLARDAALLGRLDDLPAIARGRRMGLTIAPFVFVLDHCRGLSLNHEVVEALWAPLDPLYRGEWDTIKEYELDGARYQLPAWNVDGRIVWGLTHRMLSELFRIVRGA